MFYDDPRCTKLSDRIFIFKNIIPDELLNKVNAELNLFNKEKEDISNIWSVNEWYSDRITPEFKSTFDVWKFMSELIYPELVIHPVRNLMVSIPSDEGMFVHCDSPGPGGQGELYEIDQWSACCSLQYGMIAYFGDFKGGELYYPNINIDGTIKDDISSSKEKIEEECLVVSPEPGDIVLHGACRPWDHGTKKTISGTRYAFSNFALFAKDNPGTFYNYKTTEWYEQIGKYENPTEEVLDNWNFPLKINEKFAKDIKERRNR